MLRSDPRRARSIRASGCAITLPPQASHAQTSISLSARRSCRVLPQLVRDALQVTEEAVSIQRKLVERWPHMQAELDGSLLLLASIRGE